MKEQNGISASEGGSPLAETRGHVDHTSFAEAVSRDDIRAVSWLNRLDQPGQNISDIRVILNSEHTFQTFEGVGGAFSELGWIALKALPEDKRQEVLRRLFGQGPDSAFSLCRLPIGSSDFATGPYSLNDHAGDYAMEHFSVARDHDALIPYILGARQFNPGVKIHASPWSPPGWLKTSGKIDGGKGQLLDTPEAYKAYATYFRKFIEGYAAEGIEIDRVFIQNEPDSDATFPGCVMPPWQMVRFTADYLAPELRRAGLKTGIWGGTYRTMSGLQSHRCMASESFRRVVDGCGFQYSYTEHMADLARLYPDKKIMHTESVCYRGENSAAQAFALFEDFMNTMLSGCVAFSYWNMVLNQTKTSTWGWRQNSLVTVDEGTGAIAYNPDFHIMNLISRNLRPGAKRIESFCFLLRVLAFRNPDGGIVAFLHNLGDKKTGKFDINGQKVDIELPGRSVMAIRF
jgi:glucosylceramidase